MADILIRGMEMPKDGVYWCEIGVAGDIAMITIHGEDRKSFSLVPIPPHGRLIDADALLEHMKKIHDKWKREGHDTPTTDDEIMTMYMPTIIEAEEEQK